MRDSSSQVSFKSSINNWVLLIDPTEAVSLAKKNIMTSLSEREHLTTSWEDKTLWDMDMEDKTQTKSPIIYLFIYLCFFNE